MVKPDKRHFIYVTGCDSGFGAKVVQDLFDIGFSVIAGMYLEDSVEKMKKDQSLSGKENKLLPIRVDVSHDDSVKEAALLIKKILDLNQGSLVAVINNAGKMHCSVPCEWLDPDDFRSVFETNVMGTVMTVNSLLPLLRESCGRIVNISSIGGMTGLPFSGGYTISKWGIEGYTEVLRKEVNQFGISVHVIEPGSFNSTEISKPLANSVEEKYKHVSEEIKQTYGEEYKNDVVNFFRKYQQGTSQPISMVTKAMIHAATADLPHYRYRAGNDSKYIFTIIAKLHESLQDRLLCVSFKAKKAKKVLRLRYYQDWPRFIGSICLLIAIIKLIRAAPKY